MATREWMSPMTKNHRRYGFQTNWNSQQANRESNGAIKIAIISYPTPNLEMSLEEIVKSLELSTQQFHEDMKVNLQETKVNSQDLGNQPSQLATSVSQLKTQTSKELSSRIEANPKENVIEVTLWSGKEFHPVEPAPIKAKQTRRLSTLPTCKNEKITLSDKECSRLV
ncbi:UNVERIFIED_CONTAM: hypothetical protein Sradi_1728500 [Sesamum radiatum]|uniref:Uncharacterized protein n=1 Tax=Sesamum radiatum TaxID=300843 RepID=A0AAW2TWR8_SESRA